jgi:hypothetical protein
LDTGGFCALFTSLFSRFSRRYRTQRYRYRISVSDPDPHRECGFGIRIQAVKNDYYENKNNIQNRKKEMNLNFEVLVSVFRIHDILGWIRILILLFSPFTSFFKDKKSKRDTKSKKSRIFLLFLHDDRRIRILSRIRIHTPD